MISAFRRYSVLFLVALVALVVAGCGGGDKGGGKPAGVDDLLGYVPAASPLVVTASTDVDGQQFKNVDTILKKFPISGQVKGQVLKQFKDAGLDYGKDIKPLLGGTVLIAFPDARELAAAQGDGDTPVIGAWSTSDGGKLKELITEKGKAKEVGKSNGATIYKGESDSDFFAIEGNTAVVATTRPLLEAALERHDGSDHLTKENFDKAFEGLPEDALAHFYVNAGALVGTLPGGSALSGLAGGVQGATLNVESNKVAFDAKTHGATGGATSPIAGGDESPGIVRGTDELGVAWRNIAQTVHFYETTAKAVAPQQYGTYATGKAAIGAKLGIDFDKDVIDQFSGNTYAAIGFSGWAVRSDVKDPAALTVTLAKLAKAAKGFDLDIKRAGSLYTLTDDGTTVYLGMVGKSFVVASDPDHAAAIAAREPSPLAGAKGAIAINGDGKALADAGLQRYGQGMQQQFGSLFTGPLGDINGWAGTSGSHFEVNFK